AAQARLPGLAGPTPGSLREPAPAVVVAPARPVRIPRAMSAAHGVDLERVAPLVHVPEQLEHGGVLRLAREQADRLPDARDGPGLVRLDEEIAEVDGEDPVQAHLELTGLVEIDVQPVLTP